MNVNKRIEKWFQDIIDKKEPIELISFYEELPIKAKIKPLAIEENSIQWESNPKLNLAISNFGRVYTFFHDPAYNKKRPLVADVTYYNDKFIETTHFRPFDEPRFRREFPRVTVSEKLPIKLRVIGKSERPKEYRIKDVSEMGIGFRTVVDHFKVGDKINVEVEFPYGRFQIPAEVRHVEDTGKDKIVGIKFINLDSYNRNLLHRYVVERQREILNNIRMLLD